jgi:hypothetical protein
MADEATAETTKPTAKPSGTVKYIGSADVRSISEAEWAQVGVEGQADVVWDRSNDFTVKASELSAPALEVVKRDAGFQVSV